MSDDRSPSPMDGWFRDEPGPVSPIPPATSAPYGAQGGEPETQVLPQAQAASQAPVARTAGSSAWDEYRNGGQPGAAPAGTDAPTEVGQFRAIRPDEGFRPQGPREPAPLSAPIPPASSMPVRVPGPARTPDQAPDYGNPERPRQPYQPRSAGSLDERGAAPARIGRKPLIAGGAVAGLAVLGLIGYLALGNSSPTTKDAGSAGNGPGNAASPSPTHTSFQPTSSNPAIAAEQTGTAFLNAWQSGDLQAAAKYTDNPTAALAAMNDFKSGLNLSGLTLKPQPAVVAGASPSASAGAAATSTPSGGSSAASGASANPSGTVPFAATATVGLGQQSASGQMVTAGQSGSSKDAALTWSYSSSLVAYKQSDGWSVRWNPSILAPNLTDGEKLSVVPVPPGVSKVADSAGTKLSSYSESALQNIASTLGKTAPTAGGTPGVAVQIVNASGKAVGDATATLRKPVDAPVLKTTIDPTIEALARDAVAKNARSSMVVLRPSTGAILAVANSSGSGDTALVGGLAPGSTFKIVTSAALLDYGDVTLSTPVACPLTFTVEGVVYHNSTDGTGKNEESLPANTPFLTDFAQSCNNAFTPFYKQLEGGKLAHTAATYFGLNQSWDIGLGSNDYFSIPTDSSGAELAQENFGQGRVVASPLAMASVAATVGTGSFHQPYLVDGVKKASASSLPSGTDADLKTMMRAVVTSGTAAGVFSNVSGPVYGKTGTAETDGNKDGKPNAWMVVYDPRFDVAVGVVVQDSGFGATYAGPEAAYVLSRL